MWGGQRPVAGVWGEGKRGDETTLGCFVVLLVTNSAYLEILL